MSSKRMTFIVFMGREKLRMYLPFERGLINYGMPRDSTPKTTRAR